MDGRIGLGLYQSLGTGGVLDVCLCFVFSVVWGVGRGLGPGSGGVGCCYVCVSLDSLCSWHVQVSVYYLFIADITNPDFFV